MGKRDDIFANRDLTGAQIDEALDAMRRTPPTQDIDAGTGDYIEYDEGTEVQFVCPCGCQQFSVYYEAEAYRTFVRCASCGKQEDVHTG